MSIGELSALLFGLMLLLILLGLPISFCLGASAIVFTFFQWGVKGLQIAAVAPFMTANAFILVAVPMFILMANMLERAGIAEDLYSAMHLWMGPLRGGLAMGTVLICTLFAAMSGVSATGTITMGLIALPAMLKRGYYKEMAIGCILGGGALGVLIPPSVVMIFYGLMARESVGRLYAGGVIPGLILSALFVLYIGIRCYFQPHLGPVLPLEERGSWKQKAVSLKSLILPIILIVLVLGSIFTGMASPTEASAIGAFGSILCAAANRRLRWKIVKEACYRTLRNTGMVLWILFGASSFASVYQAIGAVDFVKGIVSALPVSPIAIIAMMMFIYLILGCLLEPMTIVMLTIPLFVPIVTSLGYDSVWFGVIFVVNMEMSYLTPPVGFNLFYMKAIAPKEVTMGDIYRSIGPFVGLQATTLVLIIALPQLALWLPNLLFGAIK